MSFGFSVGDVVLLVQLAWTTVQNSRKACGEHAELTCEITSLHVNLQRLERESAKVESPINRPSDTCREDLAPIVNGCGKTLDVLDRILEKYNALSDRERSNGKLWKAVRFGNGELANVKDLRLKLIYYTANLSLFLNMVSMGSMGVVEKQMYEAGGDLKEIRRAVNNITAHLLSGANKEGSVLTEYADDDKAVWRAFRRELVKEGFSSDVIREHKTTIQAYVKELGSRGILDDEDLEDSGNVSAEIKDREPTQATPQSREEAMGSFESKSGAARDAVSSSSAEEEKNGKQELANVAKWRREQRGRRQELEENEARSIKEEKKRSLIKEGKNTDWLGPSRNRASSLDTTDPSLAGILEGLKSMGITENQIEENADFARDFIQKRLLEELKSMGITEDQIEENADFAREFIQKRRYWRESPAKYMDRASSLDTTNSSLADILGELKSMGITEDQIEENADFAREFIQKVKASSPE